MNKPLKSLKRFRSELSRRKTTRTTLGYLLILAALIGPVCDVVGGLGAPEWVLQVVIYLLLLTFPVVVVLSWTFDITVNGIERTQGLDELSAACMGTDLQPGKHDTGLVEVSNPDNRHTGNSEGDTHLHYTFLVLDKELATEESELKRFIDSVTHAEDVAKDCEVSRRSMSPKLTLAGRD